MLEVGLRGHRRTVALSALPIALVVLAACTASARAAVVPSAKVTRAYWTPQRMRSALPIGLPATASRAAHPKAPLHHRIPHLRRPPLRSHGKVFFSVFPDDFQCSATAVKAPSKSLVITAGHCSYDHGTLSPLGNAVTNWEFVPAYSHGQAPFGEWPGSTTATQAWRSSGSTISPTGDIFGGDLRFDVGAATVAPLHGKTLQSVVGGRRIGFDLSRKRTYHAIGYPAEGQFDGETEWDCDSPYKGQDGSSGQPATISIACDMTGGASGGGWVDDNGRLVSLTSYSRSGDANTLYGPYFGSAIRDFYNSVKNG